MTTKTIRNLWHNPQSAYSKKTLTYSGPVLFSHRGIEVRYNPSGSWDYMAEDFGVTQRAGFSRDAEAGIIDDILDGRQMVSDLVAESLRALGHSAIGYSDACAV